MNNSVSQSMTPTIVIDLKHNLIRIHMKTLHILGDPDYVQMLINPDKRYIALKPTTEDDHLAQKIRWTTFRTETTNTCCEIRSKYLVEALQEVCYELKYAHIYKVPGVFYPEITTAVFDINKAISITQSDEE